VPNTELGASDFDDLVALAGRCLDADGGLPLAADPSFLHRRWMTPSTLAVRDGDGRLIAAGAVRDGAVLVGLVDPAARGRGIGASVLDWGLDRAATVETEGVSPAAEKLFASRGLRQVFAEDVMRIDLTAGAPRPPWPDGTTLTGWSDATAARFHAVYDASFRERPGFPGWTAEEWIEGVDEDGLRPGWSVLATVPDIGDAGFVTASDGWIDQVGVLPEARGRGIGAALVGEALCRMRADGATFAWLNVNVDNPAAALYRRLGFVDRGRRARYQR
jgi:ribosomal protein S18 acetylase RimI-like enzyme